MFEVDGQLFHVGILVTDLDAAMHEIGASAHVSWASVRDWPMDVWLPDRGYITMEIALTFSTEGPVHLELIEGPSDTPVAATEARGTHHLGYWVDDPPSETERLLAQGWTLEMAAAAPEDGYGRFTYVRSPSGLLVEPVEARSRERFEAWWAGGDLASAKSR